MPPEGHFSCFLLGSESLLIRCGQELLRAGQEVRGVITDEPAVSAWATGEGLPAINPPRMVAELTAGKPFDYLFSVTNLRMLSASILALPKRGAINFHDGPLPRYAGMHATSWALMAGEREHGVTWHVMEAAADAGDILKQRLFPITEGETALSLNSKCYEAAVETFVELIEELAERREQRVPQDLAQRSYFARDRRPDRSGLLSFRDAESTAAMVRSLDFGPYPNPLTLPKLRVGRASVAVHDAVVVDRTTKGAGTVVEVSELGIQVATSTHDLLLREFSDLNGVAMTAADAAAVLKVHPGLVIPDHLDSKAQELAEQKASAERFWVTQLGQPKELALPFTGEPSASGTGYLSLKAEPVNLPLAGSLAVASGGDYLASAVTLLFARLTGQYEFDVWETSQHRRAAVGDLDDLFATWTPVPVRLDPSTEFEAAILAGVAGLCQGRTRATFATDVFARWPTLRSLGGRAERGVGIEISEDPATVTPPSGFALVVAISKDGARQVWHFDHARLSFRMVAGMQRQFGAFVANGLEAPETPFGALPLVDSEERTLLLQEWNATSRSFPAHELLHESFEAQAARTPNEIAVACGGRTITYDALNRRANQLARHLRELGIGQDGLVGISTGRSIEMIASVLAVHKAGGAYLPLDPDYPTDRTQFMLEDAKATVVLTDEANAGSLRDTGVTVFRVDADCAELSAEPDSNLGVSHPSSSLAYVIYTSGSTGKPKGVMVEHRNVQNFFTGMDESLHHESPGTWLAVTSLSFDISVLEVLWALTRGFKVVLYTGGAKSLVSSEASDMEPVGPLSFSLFFFSSDDGSTGGGAYDLLMDAARFADTHGFEAVWTPERHFHAFGGPFPNPSVTSAAVAAITKNVAIRAGSCVLPLHSPIRVAEEWSVVDNLSHGRAGISFAAGWQPDDFVLRPENFSDAKGVMVRDIETVRKLWRGESVAFPGFDGAPVDVTVLPRPVQRELPVWITSAGNIETFRLAGEMRTNILTHLLGQSFSEVAERIAAYRAAWDEAGHPGRGQVTLMLHTFVGESDYQVRELVREPMIEYLRSSVGLIKQFAWSFPAFKNRPAPGADTQSLFESLSDTEMRELLEHSFERYYETSGLFGTPARCAEIIKNVRTIGVDEVACLVDFGVARAKVIEGLKLLDGVRASAQGENTVARASVGDLVKQHKVTHLQCTPSMATVLMGDASAREALSTLDCMIVGGEAFPTPLANDLAATVSGQVINMYGPTETTIWSTTHEVAPGESSIPIGRPIANTSIYILDAAGNPVPVGSVGELFIGGAGVVRGYLGRPELTAERFIPNPFAQTPGERIYRTGDLARYREDGTIEFLGRIDNQVKLRGYRIELGEIETAIGVFEGVREAVVIAREDEPGDQRLAAYYVVDPGASVDRSELREALSGKLPAFMVPSAFVEMEKLPLTPNAKVDRKALPRPDAIEPSTSARPIAQASGEVEERIAGIWGQVLNTNSVDRKTTFFDLGGNSLLLVQVHRRLLDAQGPGVTLTDLFRFPTVESLAVHLEGGSASGGSPRPGRVDARRAALSRRRDSAVGVNRE